MRRSSTRMKTGATQRADGFQIPILNRISAWTICMRLIICPGSWSCAAPCFWRCASAKNMRMRRNMILSCARPNQVSTIFPGSSVMCGRRADPCRSHWTQERGRWRIISACVVSRQVCGPPEAGISWRLNIFRIYSPPAGWSALWAERFSTRNTGS